VCCRPAGQGALRVPGGVYLIQDDGRLVEMGERPYDSESVLQSLLAEYPDLLAGDQIAPDSPRRWLLISREKAVPGEQDGAARWSLDHLFLDQDAVPTLVEVKRASDTRTRREVVAQMLDYAANAVVYWSVLELVEALESQCEAHGLSGDEALERFLGEEADAGAFWERAETNLRAGRVRLVFVADQIPQELQRVVEFLNEQMDPAEVLAVEIRQFSGGGQRTLIPRVIGQTSVATQRKSGALGEKQRWDEPSFMDALAKKAGSDVAAVAASILGWAYGRGLRVWWGYGKQGGSFFPLLDQDGGVIQLVSVWTNGRVRVQFQWMLNREYHPLHDPGQRAELQRRLNALPGVAIPDDALSGRPSFPLSSLLDEDVRTEFLRTLDWVVDLALAQGSDGDTSIPD